MNSPSINVANRARDLAYEVVSKRAVITGIGVTTRDDTYVVQVNLRDEIPSGLPQQIEGVSLVYKQTGVIRTQRL